MLMNISRMATTRRSIFIAKDEKDGRYEVHSVSTTTYYLYRSTVRTVIAPQSIPYLPVVRTYLYVPYPHGYLTLSCTTTEMCLRFGVRHFQRTVEGPRTFFLLTNGQTNGDGETAKAERRKGKNMEKLKWYTMSLP